MAAARDPAGMKRDCDNRGPPDQILLTDEDRENETPQIELEGRGTFDASSMLSRVTFSPRMQRPASYMQIQGFRGYVLLQEPPSFVPLVLTPS